MRARKVQNNPENLPAECRIDLFADYLIAVGKRLKLEFKIGEKDDILIRKEVSYCIRNMLAEFDEFTEYVEEESVKN